MPGDEDAATPILVHRAGPYENLMQHCARCSAQLADHRNALWPAGQDPPSGFKEGAAIAIEDGWPKHYYTISGRDLEGAEAPCVLS